MNRRVHRYVPGWFGFAGAAGALCSVLALAGCPGTLDPELLKMATGAGGNTGTGGNAGTGGGDTGGSSPTGGATGTGGAAASNCTGGNDGATLVTGNCAVSGCHDATYASVVGAGLNLTVDSSIASRLVGVTSPGDRTAGSVCGGNTEPYLTANSNPATGLLIDKMTETNPPCGLQMPFGGIALSTTQQKCIVQWATTLTSP